MTAAELQKACNGVGLIILKQKGRGHNNPQVVLNFPELPSRAVQSMQLSPSSLYFYCSLTKPFLYAVSFIRLVKMDCFPSYIMSQGNQIKNWSIFISYLNTQNETEGKIEINQTRHLESEQLSFYLYINHLSTNKKYNL